jgi:hypothetical protein
VGTQAAIRGAALAAHQPCILHPVEQAGNVRHAAHQAVPDFVAPQARAARTAQDAQDVVLNRGQAMLLKELISGVGEQLSCTVQVEASFFLQAAKGLLLLNVLAERRDYIQKIGVITLNFKTVGGIVSTERGWTQPAASHPFKSRPQALTRIGEDAGQSGVSTSLSITS